MNLRFLFRKVLYLFVLIGLNSVSAGAYEDFFTAVKNNDASAVQALLRRGFETPGQTLASRVRGVGARRGCRQGHRGGAC